MFRFKKDLTKNERKRLISELLIEFVKNHRELYDCEHEDFKNEELKNALWEEFAEILHPPESAGTVKSRWNSLVDNYNRLKYAKTNRLHTTIASAAGSDGASVAGSASLPAAASRRAREQKAETRRVVTGSTVTATPLW